MEYGVIGNTPLAGTVILGSSPGTPALIDHRIDRPAPRSSSGPGRRPLTAVTPVQIRYGVRHESGGFVIAPFVERPRTPPSHGGNTGSTPVRGTASIRCTGASAPVRSADDRAPSGRAHPRAP